MPERLSFVCTACGLDTGTVAPRVPSWAALWGFAGSLRWLADKPAADAEALSPLCLPAAPSVGETHWLSVGKPFHATRGEMVWCLYLPPLAFYNGWDNQPDEIAGSAIVRCEMLGFRNRADRSALAEIRVCDVLKLPEIAKRLPEGEPISASELDRIVSPTRRDAVRCGSFTHLSMNFEGDLGAWAVIETRRDREVLIAAGEWGWHEDFLLAGNAPLDADAAAALRAMLGAGG
jgi:hypothetical protein